MSIKPFRDDVNVQTRNEDYVKLHVRNSQNVLRQILFKSKGLEEIT